MSAIEISPDNTASGCPSPTPTEVDDDVFTDGFIDPPIDDILFRTKVWGKRIFGGNSKTVTVDEEDFAPFSEFARCSSDYGDLSPKALEEKANEASREAFRKGLLSQGWRYPRAGNEQKELNGEASALAIANLHGDRAINFTAFPIEIRNMVYGKLLMSETGLRQLKKDYKNAKGEEIEDKIMDIAILITSKAVHDEAAMVMYWENHFAFDVDQSLECNKKVFIAQRYRQFLRKVHIRVGLIFKEVGKHREESWAIPARIARRVRKLTEGLCLCKNLQGLYVQFVMKKEYNGWSVDLASQYVVGMAGYSTALNPLLSLHQIREVRFIGHLPPHRVKELELKIKGAWNEQHEQEARGMQLIWNGDSIWRPV